MSEHLTAETYRERIAIMLARGKSRQEIADTLDIRLQAVAYHAVILSGRCGLCGSQRRGVSASLCRECLDKQAAKTGARREARSILSRCLLCGAKATPGNETCARCRQTMTARYRDRRHRGICLQCDNPADAGVMCATHRHQHNEAYRETARKIQLRNNAKAAAAGMCTACHIRRPPAKYKTCQSCRDRIALRDAKRKERGETHSKKVKR